MQTVDFDPALSLHYTTVEDGNMDERFSVRSIVMANRRKILNQLELNPRLIIEAQQPHEDRILVLTEDNTKMWYGNNIPGVDGFITNQPDLGLVLKLADCVPLVLFDPEKKVFGLIHIGWKGAVKQIHTKAVQRYIDTYESNPAQLKAWLGPSAKKCCYISQEAPDQLKDEDWKPFITKQKQGYAIDISGFVKQGLKQAGLKAKHITEDKQCTVESADLFSYTRSKASDEKEARFIVIAKLR